MQQQTAFRLNIHKCREVLNLSYKEHINKVHNEIEPKYVFSKTKFSLQKENLLLKPICSQGLNQLLFSYNRVSNISKTTQLLENEIGRENKNL